MTPKKWAPAKWKPVKLAKKRMGRPPLAVGEAKQSLLSIRVSQDERERLSAAAEASGTTLSDWARRTLLSAAGG